MKKIQCLLSVCLTGMICTFSLNSFSQISLDSLFNKKTAINLTNVQNLQFGAFTTGNSGGTISISPEGERTVTGSVVPLNLSSDHRAVIFELEVPGNSIVSIINNGTFTLNGSNGGSMQLELGKSNPSSPFSINESSAGKILVSMGGTLTVGNSSALPPGNYSGNFTISIIIE